MKRLLTLTLTVLLASTVHAEVVKKSKSGICHDTSSRSYERTKNFTPHNTIQECLDSGGRLPKGAKAPEPVAKSYKRSYFGNWIDEDKDCLNTRHELLMKLSTGTVDTGSNKCTVSRGRWLDPYTGQTFYEAKQLDVDHLVPLKWAWDHGADKWNKEKRVQFANDEANLFAVKASVNRAKGALAPMEWLPPDTSFNCQYVTRFHRIMKKYGLKFSDSESKQFRALKSRVCK